MSGVGFIKTVVYNYKATYNYSITKANNSEVGRLSVQSDFDFVPLNQIVNQIVIWGVQFTNKATNFAFYL